MTIVLVFSLLVCETMLQPFTRTNRVETLPVSHPDGYTASVPFVSFTHTCTPVEINPSNLKSQDNEDKQLLTWFHGLCNGTYLEIGGLDGVTYSNTYVFNKALDWRGVLVELSTVNYKRLVQNRPNELANIHAGVCDKKRLLHYVEGARAVGGIWEFASQSFKDQWWRGMTLESPEVKPVQCAPLGDLLEPHVGQSFFFDFFSLDVEGAEFEVLKSIDFTKLGFGIILAEADTHNHRKNMVLRTFLQERGYTFLMDLDRSYWFVNNAFSQIYGEKLYSDVTASS